MFYCINNLLCQVSALNAAKITITFFNEMGIFSNVHPKYVWNKIIEPSILNFKTNCTLWKSQTPCFSQSNFNITLNFCIKTYNFEEEKNYISLLYFLTWLCPGRIVSTCRTKICFIISLKSFLKMYLWELVKKVLI